MTTNTTNSQAASIDTPEFRQRLRSLRNYTIQEAMDTELNEICDDIDAKLAQAGDDWRDRANVLEARLGEVMEKRDEFRERAIAAESRLAEIQRGVEGLTRWMETFEDGLCQAIRNDPPSNDVFVRLTSVLALLQPQGQEDTSGLLG